MSGENSSSDTGASIKQTCLTGLDSATVTVHESPLAIGGGMSIGAIAYTSGSDIHMPRSQQSLASHEASHVIQQ